MCKLQISNLIIDDNCPSCLIEANKVVANVVEAAAANIKYEAQEDSGGYISDVFLHAPDIMFDHLAAES